MVYIFTFNHRIARTYFVKSAASWTVSGKVRFKVSGKKTHRIPAPSASAPKMMSGSASRKPPCMYNACRKMNSMGKQVDLLFYVTNDMIRYYIAIPKDYLFYQYQISK